MVFKVSKIGKLSLRIFLWLIVVLLLLIALLCCWEIIYKLRYPKIPAMPHTFKENLHGVILLPKPEFGILTDCLRWPEKCNKLLPRDGKILPIPVSEYTYYRKKGETAPFISGNSPDGRYEVYSGPEVRESFILNTKTKQEHILKIEKNYGYHISRYFWSPDSHYVIYALTTSKTKEGDSGEHYIHYIMNLETGETYRFFQDVTPVWDLYWEEK